MTGIAQRQMYASYRVGTTEKQPIARMDGLRVCPTTVPADAKENAIPTPTLEQQRQGARDAVEVLGTLPEDQLRGLRVVAEGAVQASSWLVTLTQSDP